MKKKKFKLVDAILATVCITLVAESVAPTAAIGNSQYFWWIFLIVAFLTHSYIPPSLGKLDPSSAETIPYGRQKATIKNIHQKY